MPMTDAPNFGTKFGRRKPCLRYIGPLLRTTCVAPVGRGDHTPPRTPPLPPRRGRAPSRPAGKGIVPHQFPLVPKRSPPRIGADLCVRPPPLRVTRPRADTQVGPYRFDCSLHLPPENRAGTEPRPYSRRTPNAASRSTRPPQTSSPATQNTLHDRRHPALILRPPSQRKKHPRPSPNRGFQKGGPQPPFGRFKGVPGGKQGSRRKPAQRLRWEKEEQRNE